MKCRVCGEEVIIDDDAVGPRHVRAEFLDADHKAIVDADAA